MLNVANYCRRLVAAISLLGFALIGQPLSSLAKSPDIEFELLYRAAQIANLS